MTLNALMSQLAQRDIKLSARDGNLSISAEKGAITPEIKTQLQRFKPEIIAFLSRMEIAAEAAGESGESGDVEVADQGGPWDIFPFSDLQLGFYMASDPFLEFHVRPHYYCEYDKAELDVARYERAINLALQRHKGEMVIVADDGHLRALPELPHVALQVNDFRSMEPHQAQDQLARLRSRFEREELPLGEWPWFAMQVSVWSDDGQEKFRIHANYNNFYSDGYGATLFQRDVELYYTAPTVALAPLQLSYRDAVLKLDALSRTDKGLRAQKYWLDRLPELPEPPALPLRQGMNRRVRSTLQRREGGLSAQSWNRFKQHARLFGLTPTSAVIAAYSEVLGMWSGSRHFILSNMVTRRLPVHPEIMEIVGNFASLYPLEIDLRDGASFAQKAGRIQQQILRDSDHREWGGMQVMQAFNRQKGEFGTAPCPFVVGSGLFMERYKKADFSCLETSQTMLDHQFWELEDGKYYFVWDLLEEFFPDGMIDAMWRAFGNLLLKLSESQNQWTLEKFDFAVDAYQCETAGQVVSGCLGEGGLLHRGLFAASAHTPQKTVLEMPGATISYARLADSSQAIAKRLCQMGVKQNELVALVLDRNEGLLAAALGIMQAGAAYVPIDPRLPTERAHYMLTNSRARVVLTDRRYMEQLSWPLGLQIIDVADFDAAHAHEDQQATACPAVDADLAYVIYTSGSTGSPKGVMIDHRGALNTVIDINRRFGIGAGDKVFGVSSFSFDLSVYDVFGVLEAGATLVYPSPESAMNPAHWLEVMASSEVTVWNSAPPLMSLLVETALRQRATLPALRIVMLSGDWIPIELPESIRKVAPNAKIISLGGATEASIWSIFHVIDHVDLSWTSIPYGRALTNQGWKIRDDRGRLTPLWVAGELYITGTGLAKGYWGDEEKTRASFMQDQDSERLYRTGDRGRYLPDGSIEFLGRLDSQVKVQGHRIELGEIEVALNDLAFVKEAIVLAQAINAGAGANSARAKQIVACVVMGNRLDPADPQQVEVAVRAMREALALKLPAYMIPTGWKLIAQMPLSNNGKVDRIALAKLDLSGHAIVTNRRSAQPPRTTSELKLAGIWKQVLACESVGAHDDFFEIGGQSVDAVRCMALIQETFGRSVSLGDIWIDRTIEKLALRLDAGGKGEASRCMSAIDSGKPGRPYYFVHPAGGQITGYFELGRRLERPSHGFSAVADDVDGNRLSTIESIAARYVGLVKTFQPDGPYTLGGWSSGGAIAFEMAVQLERIGEKVDKVIMLDSPAPLMHDAIDESDMLRGFYEDLDLGLNLSLIDSNEAKECLGKDRFDLVYETLAQEKDIPFDRGQLYQFYKVFKAIVDATRAYRPSTIHADIVLVRATDGKVTEFAGHPFESEPDWGWLQLTSGIVRCEHASGTHHTFLGKRFVDAVAQSINECDKGVSSDTAQVLKASLQ